MGTSWLSEFGSRVYGANCFELFLQHWPCQFALPKAFDEFRGREVAPGSDVQSDADIEAYIRQTCGTVFHPIGTCKMGTDPMAVVDPELRVHGVQGLRVVDASIMPAIITGHTNGPTIMIGEKAADLIKATKHSSEQLHQTVA